MNRTKLGGTIVAAVALLSAATASRAAGYSYATFDVPGHIITEPIGVNDHGDIVGICMTSNTEHGFLLKNGAFTILQNPNAPDDTIANGINDRGDIVGGWFASNGVEHGYTFVNSVWTTVDDPANVFGNDLGGIDLIGDVVGFFVGSDNVTHAFRLNKGNSTFQNIDSPQAFDRTFARGISSNGVFVSGSYGDVFTDNHGYLRTGSSPGTVDVPGAFNTLLAGSNDCGNSVGTWTDAFQDQEGVKHARGTFTDIYVPGSLFTSPSGINNAGVIVGFFVDPFQGFRGFVATPN